MLHRAVVRRILKSWQRRLDSILRNRRDRVASWLPADLGCRRSRGLLLTQPRGRSGGPEADVYKAGSSFGSTRTAQRERQAPGAARAPLRPRWRGRVRVSAPESTAALSCPRRSSRRGLRVNLARISPPAGAGSEPPPRRPSPQPACPPPSRGLSGPFPGVSLERPWGRGLNNSQLPVPFVALFSFDTIKVKLIDSYH